MKRSEPPAVSSGTALLCLLRGDTLPVHTLQKVFSRMIMSFIMRNRRSLKILMSGFLPAQILTSGFPDVGISNEEWESK